MRRTSPQDPLTTWARSYADRPSEFVGELIGPAWHGADWLAWRAFVKTMFAEPMDEEELTVYRRCTDLVDPPGSRQREVWLPIGRRGGKSRIIAMIAVYLACCFDWARYLAPGEFGYISVLADSRDHASQIMNYARGAIEAHPRLKPLIQRELVETIEMRGRVKIEVVTASIKAVRSRTMIAVLCDEIAFWPVDETSANPDVEILNALRPAMLTIPGSVQLAGSSRYARRGALWTNYRDHYGKVAGPLVWSADTVTMHPSVDREYIAAEYEKDPIAAEAEYGLSFRTDVVAFVTEEAVSAAVAPGIIERPRMAGVSYKAFTDPAGGSGADSFTLAIGHTGRDGGGVLDYLEEIRPPFSPDAACQRFADAMTRYGVKSVRGDHYAGDWPTERFLDKGITYVQSERTKSEIYLEWLPLLNSGRVELLDQPRLRRQAEGLERRTARSGRDSIDHAPGGHDDLINSAAGVLVEVAAEVSSWELLARKARAEREARLQADAARQRAA